VGLVVRGVSGEELKVTKRHSREEDKREQRQQKESYSVGCCFMVVGIVFLELALRLCFVMSLIVSGATLMSRVSNGDTSISGSRGPEDEV